MATIASFGGIPLFKKAFGLTDPLVLVLALSACFFADAPAHAAPRAAQRAEAPVSAEASYQKGLFLLNNDDVTDAVRDSLKKVTASDNAKRAEDAQYYLGAYFQRKYYITKGRTNVPDWASLYYADREFRKYFAKYSEQGNGRWLADTYLALALIDLERGDAIALKRHRKQLRDAQARDPDVYVYQVVWSRRTTDVIDAHFPTTFVADVLDNATAGDVSAAAIPAITAAFRARKVQSYAPNAPAAQH